MTFKEFLNQESVFGNIMPGIYTHAGYDDPIKKALRQAPGYLLNVDNHDKVVDKVKKKKRKIKKWF
jgi:hypothetical protein